MMKASLDRKRKISKLCDRNKQMSGHLLKNVALEILLQQMADRKQKEA